MKLSTKQKTWLKIAGALAVAYFGYDYYKKQQAKNDIIASTEEVGELTSIPRPMGPPQTRPMEA